MNHYGVNCTECSYFSPDPLDRAKYECKAWHLDFNIKDADMGQCSYFVRNSKMPFLKPKNDYQNERLIDITIAILKCLESNLSIPDEWINEWLELYNEKKGDNSGIH